MNRLIIQNLFAVLFVLIQPLNVLAEISVINNIPENCSNEKRIFVREQKISIGPTWVSPCKNVCIEDKQQTVWYPRTVCVDSTITAVACVADKNGCNKVVVDQSAPINFNCASNPGNGWKCVDTPVTTECAWTPNDKGVQELKIFSAPTSRAVCVLVP